MSATIPAVRVVMGPEERAAADRVLASGALVQGAEVAALEEELAGAVGADHGIAVSSGTSALHVALLAAGVGPGDEVVVPSFTFAATANTVALTGASPVFADIDPTTFCIDVDHAASLVGPRTAAIVPVHLFGHPADTDAVERLAARHDLFHLEDAAQAHLAAVGDRVVGSLGHAAAFSFYATKNMTTGEGGMITTSDAALARRARLLRNQGMERRYANEVVGLNNRMTEVAAAIGLVQLGRLPGFNDRRRAVAARYREGLGGAAVGLPTELPRARHVYHQFTIRVTDRDGVQARLLERGVQTNVYYPTPVSALPPFARDGDAERLPHTYAAAAEVLSLPMHPHLSDDEVERVVEAVREVVS